MDTDRRLGLTERRVQMLQDLAGETMVVQMRMGNEITVLQHDVADLTDDMAAVRTELSQHRRILLAIAKKLDVDVEQNGA